jgi:hypothetical protein
MKRSLRCGSAEATKHSNYSNPKNSIKGSEGGLWFAILLLPASAYHWAWSDAILSANSALATSPTMAALSLRLTKRYVERTRCIVTVWRRVSFEPVFPF